MSEDLGFDPTARAWVRHMPDWRCGQNHCYIHSVDESGVVGQVYLICYECNHVYERKRDLRREHRTVLRKIYGSSLRTWLRGLFIRARSIMVCPVCSHDF